MAKGNWRNWEEVDCSSPDCKNVIYKKYGIKKMANIIVYLA